MQWNWFVKKYIRPDPPVLGEPLGPAGRIILAGENGGGEIY